MPAHAHDGLVIAAITAIHHRCLAVFLRRLHRNDTLLPVDRAKAVGVHVVVIYVVVGVGGVLLRGVLLQLLQLSTNLHVCLTAIVEMHFRHGWLSRPKKQRGNALPKDGTHGAGVRVLLLHALHQQLQTRLEHFVHDSIILGHSYGTARR